MNALEDKVYGALIGAAIGDAMGGPVEMLTFEDAAQRYGFVRTFLPYAKERIGPHGSFCEQPGSYTDDSRMVKLLCIAMLENGIHLTGDDVAQKLIDTYYHAETTLEKSFLEEYCFKSIWRQNKQVFGGQPTNGGIMCVAPIGAVNACDAVRAHDEAFDALFFVEGYARYAAPMAAAAIAAAFGPGATPHSCVEAALQAAWRHKKRREGVQWQLWNSYPAVAKKCENLLTDALDAIAGDRETLFSRLRKVTAQPFFADGAETLAVALALGCAAESYEDAVTLCVNYGRDCDSSAAVVGALWGALSGAHAIPDEWICVVESVNPQPNFAWFAQDLTRKIAVEAAGQLHRADYLLQIAAMEGETICQTAVKSPSSKKPCKPS